MFKFTSSGNYNKTRNFLEGLLKGDIFSDLDRYGEMGVNALSQATPVDTGTTAHDWQYRIVQDNFGPGIEWYNTNVVANTPVVILIQYGHGTGTGGYVEGRDFINPTMQPLFDQIANEVWKKVKA